MTQQLEHDFSQGTAGKWAEVHKTRPGRPITLESDVLVPFSQAALLGALTAMPVTAITGLVTHDFGAAVASAFVTFGCVTAVSAFKLVDTVLSTIWQTEEYLSEIAFSESAESARVTVELVKNREVGHDVQVGGRVVYDELNCSSHDLALVLDAERLSKRGLMEIGLSDSVSMSILSELLRLGYIAREADNQPATWTAKGKALRKALR
jgi:hypothetical protein